MNTATEAQIRFINTLKEQREVPESFLEVLRVEWAGGRFTKQAASKFIDALKTFPSKGREERVQVSFEEIPEGMHVLSGQIYKVQVAKNGSGRKYAKALIQSGGKWSFEYSQGSISHLSAATVMPAEQAAEFGHLYGICCNCAADLTDEVSIFYGYGPVCAANHGWPYSKKDALASLQDFSDGGCSGCEHCDGEGSVNAESCAALAELAYEKEMA